MKDRKVKEKARYRCKDRDCHRVSFGKDLVPVKANHLVNGIKEIVISNWVCPYDRGLVEEL